MPVPEDLVARRAALAARLSARLAEPDVPLAELRELRERLDLLDGALAERRPPAGRRLAAWLWPLLAVGTVLLLAATLPIGRVPLSLTLKASALSLALPADATLGSWPLDGEFRAEGFAALESPDAALRQAAASGPLSQGLGLRAGELSVRALRLPAGAQLRLQAQPKALAVDIESSRSPVLAELELRGAATLRLGDMALAHDYPHGEWLLLRAGEAARPERAPPPLALALGSTAPLRLQGLRPTWLRFTERSQADAGAVQLQSSLQGGALTLPVTGQTLALGAGDTLEIDGLKVERCELLAGASLQLELSGSAQGLRLRVGDFERSLKPSWLEYVARHHLAQLLWGAAGLLWGALAWLRRQLAGAPLS